MVNCSILGCTSRSERKIPNITFHRFPNNRALRKLWVIATGHTNSWTPTVSSRLCSKHFEARCLRKSNKNTLLWKGSVPTIDIHTPIILDNRKRKRLQEETEDDPLAIPTSDGFQDRDPLFASTVIKSDKSPNENIENIDDLGAEFVKNIRKYDICQICLRTDRRLKSIERKLFELHDELCDYNLDTVNLQYCTECEHVLKKFYKFKMKCQQANSVLMNWVTSEDQDKTPLDRLYTLLPPSSLAFWTPNNSSVFWFAEETGNRELNSDAPRNEIIKEEDTEIDIEENDLEQYFTNTGISPNAFEMTPNDHQEISPNAFEMTPNDHQEISSNACEMTAEDHRSISSNEFEMTSDDHRSISSNEFEMTSDDDQQMSSNPFEMTPDDHQEISSNEFETASDDDTEDKQPELFYYEIEVTNNIVNHDHSYFQSEYVIDAESHEKAVKESRNMRRKQRRIEKKKREVDDMISLLDANVSRDIAKVEDFKEKSKLLRRVNAKFTRVRFMTELKRKLATCGELVTEDGTAIDKEIVLNCAENRLKEEVMEMHWKVIRGKKKIAPRTLNMFKLIQARYRNDLEYEMVFDIEYLNTKEKMKEEFQKRRTYGCYVNSEYKCEICYQGFKFQKLLDYHHKNYHDESAGNTVCPICNIRFRSRTRSVMPHVFTVHEAVYKCKICPLVTYYRECMKNHYDQHMGKQYRCKPCDLAYKSRLAYLCHMGTVNAAHKAARHACISCARVFDTELALKAHRSRQHADEPPMVSGAGVKCDRCDLTFRTPEVYTKHVHISH